MERSPFSWRERELLALIVIVFAGYFIGMEYPRLRGEESRRAQVAVEILRTGDWIVPRQQEMPFLSRPPAGSWPIAILGVLRGEVDVAAARIPSFLSILLTSLICYRYGRQFLSPIGALAAGAGFATMAQVLQLGRLAESEAIFTFFVSASLLVWHGGHTAQPRAVWPWVVSYMFVALGALTKGPQAPVYYGATVGLYLLWQRQWRTIFSWQHFVGIGTFVLIFGGWLLPFYLQMDYPSVRKIFGADVAMRFVDLSPWVIVRHLVGFPFETFAVMLPWSLLLFGFLSRNVRANTAYARPWIGFAVIALLISFPTVWFAPLATTRYYMPLFPMVAVLGAVVFEQWAYAWPDSRLWSLAPKGWSIAMLLAATLVLTVACYHPGRLALAAIPIPFAAAFVGGVLVIVAILMMSRQPSPNAARRQLLCLASFMVLGNVLVYLPNQQRRSIDNAAEVAEAKSLLGDEKLVSLDQTHHLFAYYYKQPIPQLTWPSPTIQDADFTYFCYSTEYNPPTNFPFPWEIVKVVNCDRAKYDNPKMTVVIGRRIRPDEDASRKMQLAPSTN